MINGTEKTYTRSLWALCWSLLFKTKSVKSLTIKDDTVIADQNIIANTSASCRKIDRRFGLTKLEISDNNSSIVYFVANQKNCDEIFSSIYFNRNLTQFNQLIAKIEKFTNADKYVANSALLKFIDGVKAEFDLISKLDKSKLDIEKSEKIIFIEEFLRNSRPIIDKCNQTFIRNDSVKYNHLFVEITKDNKEKSLTQKQREAALTDEDNTLVVAGAGSGKTQLIINKVSYLLSKGSYQSCDILVLAFNNKIKKEIIEKFKKCNVNVDVHTFHSLGNLIIKQISSKKPSITKFEEDDIKLPQFIEVKIIEMLNKGEISAGDLADNFYEHKTPYDFDNIGEYEDYIKSVKLVNLQGEKVKSSEELKISNYLVRNCINFRYEEYYAIDTSNKEYSKYRPDFTIYCGNPADPNCKKIYLEHFAINADGSSIFKEKYISDMKWKQEEHIKNQTILIESHSYNFSQNNWQSNLRDQLEQHGVKFEKQLNDLELLERLKEHSYITKYAKLMATFLKHFKGNSHSLKSLRSLATDNKDVRFSSFLSVFEQVYDYYESELKSNNEIDFSDMINIAAGRIADTDVKYKLIIVDEFQDISTARANLLKEVRKQNDFVHLFCVGDDWQSIYRFAGGNITLMSEFEKEFGYSKRIDLDRTFRYNSSINAISAEFIQKNDKQLKKNISVRDEMITAAPMVYIASSDKTTVAQIVERIEAEYHDKTKLPEKTLLILARYKYQLDKLELSPKYLKIKKLDQESHGNPNTSQGMTIHASKGLEADFVIVLNNDVDSFPSAIQDDSILEYVLPLGEDFKHAEERRLFYVAITRAKDKVYLLTDEKKPSPFIAELLNDDCYDIVKFEDEEYLNISCPNCKTGFLSRVKWKSADKYFYKCNHNYHCCRSDKDLINACPECNYGYIDPKNYKCSSTDCITNKPDSKIKIMKCPKCDGYLEKRLNRNTNKSFYGCVNHKVTGCKGSKNYS